MIRISKSMLAPVLILAVSGSVSGQDTEEGVRLYREGRHEAARDILASALEVEPQNARARGYLGLALVELGQHDLAEGHLNQAVEDNGEADRGLFLLGLGRIHLDRQNSDAAVAALDRAAAEESSNADVFYYRGLAHAARRDFAASARDLERSLSIDPGRAMAHYYAGLAYNGLRQRDRMLQHFQTFLRLAPDAPEAERVRSLLRSAR